MKILPLVAIVGALAGQFGTKADTPEAEALDRLNFLKGDWACEATGEIGDVPGKVSCEWAKGSKFLVCTGEWKRPDGAVEINDVWGYNTHAGVYTWYRYWSNGYSDFTRGWVRDKTWTFVENELLNDHLRRRQVTIEERSPDEWFYNAEYSNQGEAWRTAQTGTCRRAQ